MSLEEKLDRVIEAVKAMRRILVEHRSEITKISERLDLQDRLKEEEET